MLSDLLSKYSLGFGWGSFSVQCNELIGLATTYIAFPYGGKKKTTNEEEIQYKSWKQGDIFPQKQIFKFQYMFFAMAVPIKLLFFFS